MSKMLEKLKRPMKNNLIIKIVPIIIIVLSIFMFLTTACESNNAAKTLAETTSAPPPTQSPISPITQEDIFLLLNKSIESSEISRSFEFQTNSYKTNGSFLGFDKKDVIVKGKGTITIMLSTNRNVVIDHKSKDIYISFGETVVTPTTDIPEKWDFIAANEKNKEKDQTSIDKKIDDFRSSFQKDSKTSVFDDNTIQQIKNEIDQQKREKSDIEKQRIEEETITLIASRLKTQFEIESYKINVIFD